MCFFCLTLYISFGHPQGETREGCGKKSFGDSGAEPPALIPDTHRSMLQLMISMPSQEGHDLGHPADGRIPGPLAKLKIKPVPLEDNSDESILRAPSSLLHLLSRLSGLCTYKY